MISCCVINLVLALMDKIEGGGRQVPKKEGHKWGLVRG